MLKEIYYSKKPNSNLYTKFFLYSVTDCSMRPKDCSLCAKMNKKALGWLQGTKGGKSDARYIVRAIKQ